MISFEFSSTVGECDLGQRAFDVFSLLKSEYRYKSMKLLFFRELINFKTIYTFLEQRFDENFGNFGKGNFGGKNLLGKKSFSVN